MLREIKTANAGSKKSETAVEMLIACHDRIRNFTSVVKKLAHAEGSSDEEIRAAVEVCDVPIPGTAVINHVTISGTYSDCADATNPGVASVDGP